MLQQKGERQIIVHVEDSNDGKEIEPDLYMLTIFLNIQWNWCKKGSEQGTRLGQ